MKNRLRNINVNGQAFVYWFTKGKVFILYLSVKGNKNIRIKLIFDASLIAPTDNIHAFWAFYEVKYFKNGYEGCINLARPKGVSELLNHLIIYKVLLFNQTKQFVTIDGMLILNQMGYSNIEPVWVSEW